MKLTEKRRFQSISSLQSIGKTGGTFYDKVSVEIEEICQPLGISESQCEEFMKILNREIDIGISEKCDTRDGLKMVNTFITEIASHKEPASYLTLDFKGKYYRLLLLNISAEFDHCVADETLYIIPKKLRFGTAEQIFNYIAETMKDFLQIRGLERESYEMAFAFHYPVEMRSINEAYVISFTKEFVCPSIVGREVVGLLQDAINKVGLKIHICALLNDTVGALAAGAARDPECRIGLIVSSGTNCSYFEKTALIKKPLMLAKGATELVMNTEWGGLGDNGCLDNYRTEFDKQVDLHSANPGKQIFEKMVATLYVGELCRLVMIKAINTAQLFSGTVPEKLTYENSFTSQYLFEIDREPPDCYHSAEIIMRDRFRVSALRKIDLVNIRFICRAVVNRCASLVGAACAAVIKRIGQKRITLAVDGAFFRFSETFSKVLVDVIAHLIPYTYTFKLKFVDDASGKGAVAIVATHIATSKANQMRSDVLYRAQN